MRRFLVTPSFVSFLFHYFNCKSALGRSDAFIIFPIVFLGLAHQLHERGVAACPYSQAVVKRLIPRETERTTGLQPY